jgi:hypothetical protein
VIGGIPQTGQYTASVNIDYYSAEMIAFHSNSLDEITFTPVWNSLDRTVTYATGSYIVFKRQNGSPRNSNENGYMLAMLNFQQEYRQSQKPRMRVFLHDNLTTINKFSRIPNEKRSSISQNMYYQLVDAYTKDVVVPFTTASYATRLSCDGEGMYFDFDMADLVVNKVYEFEYMLFDNNNTLWFKNLGYRFKVV